MIAINMTEKGGEQRRLEFDRDEVTIGRVQGNDIVLAKGNVSKRHARIVNKEGKLVVVDLKSTNGTYVNGRKISTPIVVSSADKIYVGDFIIMVDAEANAVRPRSASIPPAPVAPPPAVAAPPPVASAPPPVAAPVDEAFTIGEISGEPDYGDILAEEGGLELDMELAPPGAASPPPASAPPRQASAPPRQASAPPRQASAPPRQASAPPRQASAPPRQASAPPRTAPPATIPPSIPPAAMAANAPATNNAPPPAGFGGSGSIPDAPPPTMPPMEAPIPEPRVASSVPTMAVPHPSSARPSRTVAGMPAGPIPGIAESDEQFTYSDEGGTPQATSHYEPPPKAEPAYRKATAIAPPASTPVRTPIDELAPFVAELSALVSADLGLENIPYSRAGASGLKNKALQSAKRQVVQFRSRLSADQSADAIISRSVAEAIGLGPLDDLIYQPGVISASIDGSGSVWTVSRDSVSRVEVGFSSPQSIRRLRSRLGVHGESGASRCEEWVVHAAGDSLRLQHFSPTSLSDLVLRGSANADLAAHLESVVSSFGNLLVCGNQTECAPWLSAISGLVDSDLLVASCGIPSFSTHAARWALGTDLQSLLNLAPDLVVARLDCFSGPLSAYLTSGTSGVVAHCSAIEGETGWQQLLALLGGSPVASNAVKGVLHIAPGGQLGSYNEVTSGGVLRRLF